MEKREDSGAGKFGGGSQLLYIGRGLGRRVVNGRLSGGRWGAPLFIVSGEGTRPGADYWRGMGGGGAASFPLAAKGAGGERHGGARQRMAMACLCSNEEEMWSAGPDGPKSQVGRSTAVK
jgi:hypothetical protein